MKGAGWSVVGVLGQGPFVEIGDPTAIDASAGLVVVGGDLGSPQWEGRDVRSWSDLPADWWPIGVYERDTLACLRVVTSRWPVNGIAIHPSERFVAIGTGRYDGGYFFRGELLVHDLASGRTASLLTSCRCVEHVTWLDDERLGIVLAPATDDDIDDRSTIEHEHLELASARWTSVDQRSLDVDALPTVRRPARPRDVDLVRRAVAGQTTAHGRRWELRRQVWALAPAGRGVLAGRESSVERWDGGGDTAPVWRVDVQGTCTQLFTGAGPAVAGVRGSRAADSLDRESQVWQVDVTSGERQVLAAPGFPAVLSCRSDGQLLVRDAGHRRGEVRPATVITPSGSTVGEVVLGSYDPFNHYFDIRRSPEFLVLTGDEPRAWENKYVTEVRRSGPGWKAERLFPLDWNGTRHLFGGPGVFLGGPDGPGIVHAGAVHDGAGLLRGNAFVVRRHYPDGRPVWHVALDNTVVALDEAGGVVVALTNLGEVFGIDAETGSSRWPPGRLQVAGSPVVPLSLVLDTATSAWIGTMDGRVLRVVLPGD